MAGTVTVFVFTAVTWPSAEVVIESIAVNVPPGAGEALLVLSVLTTLAWFIVTVVFPDWFAVNEPPPDIAVPADTVIVPFPILLVKAIVPVASGNVITWSAVNVPANNVNSFPSAALPSKTTPLEVDTVSTLLVVVVPTTVKLPAITTSFGKPITMSPLTLVTSISFVVPSTFIKSWDKSLPFNKIAAPPDTVSVVKLYVVSVFIEEIVIVSVVALVVIVTLLPAARVKVSLLLSATTVDCPETATFLNMFCAEPGSVLFIIGSLDVPVTDIPVPAVTEVTASKLAI